VAPDEYDNHTGDDEMTTRDDLPTVQSPELLPRTCYATHPTDASLILLKRGETGYYPTEGYSLNNAVPTFDELADLLNERLGVTKAQRAAMEAGSLFGWHVPAADPTHYDCAGRLR
jgi:hypothetical protein